MSNTILIKRSGTANAVPSAGNLALGELAINYADGNLFYKDGGDTVQTIASKKFVSVSGNITGANVNTGGLSLSGNVLSAINSTSNVNTTGNVSANYFLGNGRFLTGIDTTLISNGNASVQTLQNANITVNPAGTANVAVFSSSGAYITGVVSATGNITGSYFIGNGSQLTGVTAASVDANNLTGNTLSSTVVNSSLTSVGTLISLSVSGNTSTGNLLTDGLYHANGVPWDFQQPAGANTQIQFNDGAGGFGASANLTFNDATRVLSVTGSQTVSGNVVGGNILTGGRVSATGNVDAGNVNATTLQVSGTGTAINASSGNILTNQVTGTQFNFLNGIYTASLTGAGATGNYTLNLPANVGANNQLLSSDGTGNLLWIAPPSTNNIFNGNSNVTIATAGSNVNTSVGGVANVFVVTPSSANVTGNFEVSGNISAGNLAITGSGNITGANVISATTLSAAANVIASNVNSGTLSLSSNVISAINSTSNITTTANITGGNLITTGTVSTSGNLAANNLSATNSVTSTVVSASGNVTGGNLFTGGAISATGNLTSGNVNTGILSLSGNVISPINTTSNITTTATVTSGNVAATYVSASGNVDGGNVNVATKLFTANIIGKTADLTFESQGNGNINLYPAGSGNIVLNSNYINSVANPVQDQDVATKIYVDNLVATGLTYHEAVAVATTDNLATTTGGTITYAQPNGAGNGIGATLTTTGSFNLIDTANVQTVGTRILVKNEGNAVLNGVYTWSNATVITRSVDADQYGTDSAQALSLNSYFFTESGNVNKGSSFVVAEPTGAITFGTSNIVFDLFSTSQVYSANTQAGISLIGTVFLAKVDNTTTAFDGGGNIVVKASANLTTPNIGAATGTSLSVTGTVTAGNVDAGAGFISTTGNVIGGNVNTGGLISATGNITSAANIAGGNISTAGAISATGTATVGNVSTGGTISATGNISTGAALNATGTATVGNVSTSGTISATGNISTGAALNATGTATVGNVSTSGTVSAGGNVTGANILTAGNVSATGNVTGGNLVSSGAVIGNIDVGNISASGNIVVNSVTANSFVSAVANVVAGNLLTGGLVSATGNVTAGNITTGGTFSATGNIAAANFLTTGLISATGNITGGNLIAANANVGNVLFGVGIVSGTGNITGGNVFQGPNQVLDTASTVDGGLY
jgi:hypothetical protein